MTMVAGRELRQRRDAAQRSVLHRSNMEGMTP
jgi:hypothetical protein